MLSTTLLLTFPTTDGGWFLREVSARTMRYGSETSKLDRNRVSAPLFQTRLRPSSTTVEKQSHLRIEIREVGLPCKLAVAENQRGCFVQVAAIRWVGSGSTLPFFIEMVCRPRSN